MVQSRRAAADRSRWTVAAKLPLAILPPQRAVPRAAVDGRVPRGLDVRWLGAEKSLVYLPTVSSPRSRQLPAASLAASRSFGGVGNPLLKAPANASGPASGQVYRADGLADPRYLNSLAPLPETQVELFALAQMQGAAREDVLVAGATETNLRKMPLADFKVLLFATHGLVAGEAGGIDEPGLVLTPPTTATTADDGYLGPSEVMGLKLNAELVILSACNTAVGDGRANAADCQASRAAS